MKKSKKILSLIAAAAIAASAAGCTSTGTQNISETPIDGSFHTTIMDTGKSDAIILRTENHCAIIDTGEKNDGKDLIAKLNEYGISTVDYLFITHFDQDHVGGAPKLMKNISIGEIITPDYEGNNSEYEKFIAACSELQTEPTRLTENMTVTLDDVTLEIYPPMQETYAEEDNDYSLVIKAVHGSNVLLFTGDAETERLSELSDQIGDLNAVFLKMPHHGRYHDGLDEFIDAVDPKYAVITCSEDEGAEQKTLALLSNVKTFLTVDGEVEVISNGTDMSVTQTPPAASTESP